MEYLWWPLTSAIRSGRVVIDSVMVMDELRQKTGGTAYGRDIKSAFNVLDKNKMSAILEQHPDMTTWIDQLL